MTIEELKEKGLILLECISGSRAYGLDTPTSDTDIKGVFILPKKEFYAMNYIPQVNNESNDIVYYELGRYIELLSVNNPNILELLNTPEDSVIYKHPILDRLQSTDILSKLCENTFGRFAVSQIRKAKGLNKKIVNPVDKKRKSVIDFCIVNYVNGSIPFNKFLEIRNWEPQYCGLVNIPNMKNLYGLYYNESEPYNGIAKHSDSNDVCLSSIPKEEKQIAILYFNKDGYSKYCKDYKEYWDWVEKRNDTRYENTQSHGKNYDAKNMMHTFRLLQMAIEIANESKINVRRPEREFLLNIKSGKYEYEELLTKSTEKQAEMEEAFKNSTLPEKPDLKILNKLHYELRRELYTF
jgi:hypothetical protein